LTKVLLVRHGATDWNIYKRAQGQADIPLDETGKLQALETAEQLSSLDIDAVYSSDLSRARDTAAAIANHQGLEVITDERFREIDQGEWTGLPVAEIARRWPDLWGAARHYNARPGGESPHQVRERALAALRDAVEAHPDGTIVVVSHGGTIRWLSAEAMGYDDHASAGLRGVGNGGVVSLKADIENGELVLWDLERLDGATPDLDDPND
jgi:broad specificity phosphatase PhoE